MPVNERFIILFVSSLVAARISPRLTPTHTMVSVEVSRRGMCYRRRPMASILARPGHSPVSDGVSLPITGVTVTHRVKLTAGLLVHVFAASIGRGHAVALLTATPVIAPCSSSGGGGGGGSSGGCSRRRVVALAVTFVAHVIKRLHPSGVDRHSPAHGRSPTVANRGVVVV